MTLHGVCCHTSVAAAVAATATAAATATSFVVAHFLTISLFVNKHELNLCLEILMFHRLCPHVKKIMKIKFIHTKKRYRGMRDQSCNPRKTKSYESMYITVI